MHRGKVVLAQIVAAARVQRSTGISSLTACHSEFLYRRSPFSVPISSRRRSPTPLILCPSSAQLGALVINLSPSRLKGLFPGKTGPTKVLHMAFEVARDTSMAPVVIYIDECDQVYFQRSATTSYRPYRVLIFGSTSLVPALVAADSMRRTFLFMPCLCLHRPSCIGGLLQTFRGTISS